MIPSYRVNIQLTKIYIKIVALTLFDVVPLWCKATKMRLKNISIWTIIMIVLIIRIIFAFYRTILYFFALDFKALERELRSIGIKVL